MPPVGLALGVPFTPGEELHAFGAAPAAGGILTEASDLLLLEDAFYLILES